MFFESFSKGPRGFPYVFSTTYKIPTLESVDGLTFVFHGVLVLGVKQVFKGGFEVGMHAILTIDLFDTFA